MSKAKDHDSLFPPPPALIEPLGPQVGVCGLAAVVGALVAFVLGEGLGRGAHAALVFVGAGVGYALPKLPWGAWLPAEAAAPAETSVAAEPQASDPATTSPDPGAEAPESAPESEAAPEPPADEAPDAPR